MEHRRHGETILYRYDSRDNLLCAAKPTERVTFTYDPFGRRMTKKVEVLDKEWLAVHFLRFLWEGDEELGAVDEDGNLIELRIPGEGMALAFELAGIPYVPLHNLRGDVVALTDLNGSLVERYSYSTFGAGAFRSLVGNPWRYSGKRFDGELGLYSFPYRMYFPLGGRWLTPDPFGVQQGLNLYRYCHNNPWNYVDYDGQQGALIYLPLVAEGAVITLPLVGTILGVIIACYLIWEGANAIAKYVNGHRISRPIEIKIALDQPRSNPVKVTPRAGGGTSIGAMPTSYTTPTMPSMAVLQKWVRSGDPKTC